MKFKLSLPVSNASIEEILNIAFAPMYQFAYNSTTGALETVIDASQEFTPAQYGVVARDNTTTIVIPGVVLPTPTTPA